MTIRAYSSTDRGACLSIFLSNVPDYFSQDEEDAFSAFLFHPRATLLCGEEGAEVVAFGGYYVRENVGRLCWGMVHGGRQGHGFGAEMLRARMDALLRLPEVHAIQTTTSQRSAGFFERFGFVRKSFAADGHAPGLHAVEMEFVPAGRQAPPPAFPPKEGPGAGPDGGSPVR